LWSLALREGRRLRVLRRIFGTKRDEVTGEWRKLHNDELHYLYSTQYFVGDKIEQNEMGGDVAQMGDGRSVYKVLVGKTEGKDQWGDPGVDGRIILRWIFRKWDVGVGTGLSWLVIGKVGGHL
jgi:hypothetical protein